jgi:hypothetical protein
MRPRPNESASYPTGEAVAVKRPALPVMAAVDVRVLGAVEGTVELAHDVIVTLAHVHVHQPPRRGRHLGRTQGGGQGIRCGAVLGEHDLGQGSGGRLQNSLWEFIHRLAPAPEPCWLRVRLDVDGAAWGARGGHFRSMILSGGNRIHNNVITVNILMVA